MTTAISVIVPFYNESQNVAPLAERIRMQFEAMGREDYECLFVNDGSVDGTREAIDSWAASDPAHHRALHLKRNFGQSAALLAGMTQARGNYLLTLDGDLQNDPADFPAFIEALQSYDCVCGYRQHRQDSLVRRLSSAVANKVRRAILQDGVRDAGCGAKGFRRVCVRHFVSFNGMHRYFPVLVRAAGLTVTEIPVAHHPREHGVSKYGLNNRLWRGLYDLVGVAWLRRRYVPYEIEGAGH